MIIYTRRAKESHLSSGRGGTRYILWPRVIFAQSVRSIQLRKYRAVLACGVGEGRVEFTRLSTINPKNPTGRRRRRPRRRVVVVVPRQKYLLRGTVINFGGASTLPNLYKRRSRIHTYYKYTAEGQIISHGEQTVATVRSRLSVKIYRYRPMLQIDHIYIYYNTLYRVTRIRFTGRDGFFFITTCTIYMCYTNTLHLRIRLDTLYLRIQARTHGYFFSTAQRFLIGLGMGQGWFFFISITIIIEGRENNITPAPAAT